jgi:hypothetical protein
MMLLERGLDPAPDASAAERVPAIGPAVHQGP